MRLCVWANWWKCLFNAEILKWYLPESLPCFNSISRQALEMTTHWEGCSQIKILIKQWYSVSLRPFKKHKSWSIRHKDNELEAKWSQKSETLKWGSFQDQKCKSTQKGMHNLTSQRQQKIISAKRIMNCRRNPSHESPPPLSHPSSVALVSLISPAPRAETPNPPMTWSLMWQPTSWASCPQTLTWRRWCGASPPVTIRAWTQCWCRRWDASTTCSAPSETPASTFRRPSRYKTLLGWGGSCLYYNISYWATLDDVAEFFGHDVQHATY